MAQPLDPVGPAVPGRPPLRHRVPGQGRGRNRETETPDGSRPESDDRDDRQGRDGPPKPPGRPDDPDDGHLIDEYA